VQYTAALAQAKPYGIVAPMEQGNMILVGEKYEDLN
jgi:hypothetical protein